MTEHPASAAVVVDGIRARRKTFEAYVWLTEIIRSRTSRNFLECKLPLYCFPSSTCSGGPPLTPNGKVNGAPPSSAGWPKPYRRGSVIHHPIWRVRSGVSGQSFWP